MEENSVKSVIYANVHLSGEYINHCMLKWWWKSDPKRCQPQHCQYPYSWHRAIAFSLLPKELKFLIPFYICKYIQNSLSLVQSERNMKDKEMKKDWRWEHNGTFFFYLSCIFSRLIPSKSLLISHTYLYMHSANNWNQSNIWRPMGYFLWGDGQMSFTSNIP